MEPKRKIMKAIVKLQDLQPFFAYLAMNLKIIKTDQIPTMGVDGKMNIYYSENFINNVIPDNDTLIGCMCHETLHIALEHIGRLGSRYKMLSNIAQDMVVNIICVNNNLKIISGEGYVNVDGYKNIGWINLGQEKIHIDNVSEKSWERIYDEILEQLKDPGKTEDIISGGAMSIGFDTHMHEEFKNLSKEEQNMIQEQMKDILVNGYTYAKQMGKTPGNMDMYIDKLLNPKIPWQNKLRVYIKDNIDPSDWTYRKPHRKSHQLGIFLPSVLKENIEFEVVIDTSGSIGQDIYTEFMSEVYGMLKSFPNVTINIVFGDTKIRNEHMLNTNKINELKTLPVKGGGGTDMEYVLDQLKDNERNQRLVIVLTDGYTQCNRDINHYPFKVLWVLPEYSRSDHLKYGEIININP